MFSCGDPDGALGSDSRRTESVFPHEVINTIMLNFIAVALVSYFTQYHYRDPRDPIMETVAIGDGAHIPRMGTFIPGFPERIPLNVAFSPCTALLSVGLSISGARSGATKYAPPAVPRPLNTAASRSKSRSFWRWLFPARSRVWSESTKYSVIAIVTTMGFRQLWLYRNRRRAAWAAIIRLAIIVPCCSPVLQHGGIYVDGFSEHITKDIVRFCRASSFCLWLRRFSSGP